MRRGRPQWLFLRGQHSIHRRVPAARAVPRALPGRRLRNCGSAPGGANEAVALARDSVAQSVTLLRNDRRRLPLSRAVVLVREDTDGLTDGRVAGAAQLPARLLARHYTVVEVQYPAELKGSIGEGPNHSNHSNHSNSFKIRIFRDFSLENSKISENFNIF